MNAVVWTDQDETGHRRVRIGSCAYHDWNSPDLLPAGMENIRFSRRECSGCGAVEYYEAIRRATYDSVEGNFTRGRRLTREEVVALTGSEWCW